MASKGYLLIQVELYAGALDPPSHDLPGGIEDPLPPNEIAEPQEERIVSLLGNVGSLALGPSPKVPGACQVEDGLPDLLLSLCWVEVSLDQYLCYHS